MESKYYDIIYNENQHQGRLGHYLYPRNVDTRPKVDDDLHVKSK